MMLHPRAESDLYEYDPSLAAAIVFAVAFGLTSIYHTYQLGRWKTWYFIPFLIGVLFQTFGYALRAISANQKPDYTKAPYIIQAVLILLAPALNAASIYMVLGRIIRLLEADAYALIKPNWLTKLFVTCDVVSFLAQGAGGGMLSSADTKEQRDRGQTIIVVGLFIQLFAFGAFMIVTALFHRRIHIRPTARGQSLSVPWLRYIYVLYIASVLIMIRSIFRVIEYIQGKDGELQSNEIYFYLLDTLLMFFVSVIFNVFHPKTIIVSEQKQMTQLMDIRQDSQETV